MYLRHTTTTKNGKTRVYWRLVQSVRCGKRVRQVTVAQLGELDAQGRLAAKALAEQIVGVERTPGLFDEDLPDEPIALKAKELRLERGRRFGDVWLAWKLWHALGLDGVLDECIPQGREEIRWASMAAVLVIARLCEPSSELHIAEDWFRRTALGDLLGIADEKVNDDRCYRALDRLLPHQATLEKHLKNRFGELFAVDYDLLLYDVTSTYFEGQAPANPMAQRGHSRDHRRDCKQVCIGLVVTRDGFPLGFEVFPGNRHDSKTLREIVERMESRYGQASRIWALDRGMVSEKHLDWLRERGSRYIVGTPKNQLKQWERQLLEGEWSTIREGLEVKLIPVTLPTSSPTLSNDSPTVSNPSPRSSSDRLVSPSDSAMSPSDSAETFILCRSEDRAAKEQAMRERFATRIEAHLIKIAESCRRRRCLPGVIERRIGRLLQRNQRAARFYDIRVSAAEDGSAHLDWSRRDVEWQRAINRDGCYVLRSNVTDWTADDLWKAYIQLTQAEAAFRIQKDDLRIRPVWHQTPERVRAHILVCFLAYALWKTLEGWTKRAGLGSSIPTVLEEFARIQSTDVVIPTEDGRQVRLRCIVHPDAAQKTLLDRLGLILPNRLRLPRGVGQM